MPVWAIWDADPQLLWFTSGINSRKARNLAADPRCAGSTEDADNPVLLEGQAEIVRDDASIARVSELMNAKYEVFYKVLVQPALLLWLQNSSATEIGRAHV